MLILTSGLVVVLKKFLRKRRCIDRKDEASDVNQNSNENQSLQPADSEIVASSSSGINQYDYPSCRIKTRKTTYELREEERDNIFEIARHDYCILANVEEDTGYQALKKYKIYQENN